jgi:beta-lactamase class A
VADLSAFGTRVAATRISRRGFVVLAGATAIASRAGVGHARAASLAGLVTELARLEDASGGRLGVAVLDTRDGTLIAHRGDERFPLCSTFKLLAAGAILARVDAGQEWLARRVRFEKSAVVTYSPATERHAGGEGLTIDQLCEAAITLSDNTAGNLLLEAIGGPAGLTQFARSLGDATTRLDRIETALNEAVPGDPRDTTTPTVMLRDLDKLVLGDALKAESRAHLVGWLMANKTGGTRLRAGLPADWRIGDKTGSGDRGTANDVGVIWPPTRAPLIVAAYLTGTDAAVEQRNATHAGIGRAVAAALG